MSEAERYYIGVFGGEAQARVCLRGLAGMIRDSEGRHFTLAEDFDRVTAERDAALADVELWRSRCSAKCYEVDALQQRLTAADERRDYLEDLMQMFIDNSDDKDVVELCMNALQPAGGGGDEA